MRQKDFVTTHYYLKDNPFPSSAFAVWGNSDPRTNGTLYNTEAFKDYEQALVKFIVNPMDSRTKFHFLWSLGSGSEARGYGKTATLLAIARAVNLDLGLSVLSTRGFEENEARQNPIIAAVGTFDKNDVPSLAAVSLEQVKYLVTPESREGSTLEKLRKRVVERTRIEAEEAIVPDAGSQSASERIFEKLRRTDLGIRGKTVGHLDPKFVSFFSENEFNHLFEYCKQCKPGRAFDLLHTVFVIAKAAGVQRVFMLIDQVEDLAAPETTRKRRNLEVERFRDLAIEAQPFSEMSSYVLTMHPDAARIIEEPWLLARLPRMEHNLVQNERVRVVISSLEARDEAEKLLRTYLNEYRNPGAPDPIFPFTDDAVEALRKITRGRPGEILAKANMLITAGAASGWETIDGNRVKEFLRDEIIPESSGERRHRPGVIDL